MTTGIYHDMPWAEYVKVPAYNPSAVKRLIEYSPKAMQHAMECGTSQTPAMVIGSATHTAILEPDQFPRRYVLWNGGVRRGKEWDAFVAANKPRQPLTESEYVQACDLRDAVRGHASSMELLSLPGHAEVSVLWQDSITRLNCKGRVDWLATGPDGIHIVDVKTTADHRLHSFARQAANLLYHVQLAAYADAIESVTGKRPIVHVIAVGTAEPYDVVRYDVPGVTLRAGLRKWRTALQRVLWCETTNTWPGYADEPLTLELPEWAMDEDEPLVDYDNLNGAN